MDLAFAFKMRLEGDDRYKYMWLHHNAYNQPNLDDHARDGLLKRNVGKLLMQEDFSSVVKNIHIRICIR